MSIYWSSKDEYGGIVLDDGGYGGPPDGLIRELARTIIRHVVDDD